MTSPDAPSQEPTVVGLMARKARMTEGQLYTVVIVALAVILLTLTGLPNAHRTDQGTTPVVTGLGASGRLPSVSEADNPATPILAIVSPVASPACRAAGSATLLVPIVGGLVGTTLGIGGTVNVADLVLNSIGPLYVVCGELPSSPGTRCSLDANISGIWPAELSSFGLAAPVVVGNVSDALDALLKLAGVPPVAQVAQVLQCEVPAGMGAVTAPVAPPSSGVGAPVAPTGGGYQAPSADAYSGVIAGGLPSVPNGSPSVTAPREVPVVGALVSNLGEHVPGGVHALQVLAALLLALCLLRSWYSSWRLASADDTART